MSTPTPSAANTATNSSSKTLFYAAIGGIVGVILLSICCVFTLHYRRKRVLAQKLEQITVAINKTVEHEHQKKVNVAIDDRAFANADELIAYQKSGDKDGPDGKEHRHRHEEEEARRQRHKGGRRNPEDGPPDDPGDQVARRQARQPQQPSPGMAPYPPPPPGSEDPNLMQDPRYNMDNMEQQQQPYSPQPPPAAMHGQRPLPRQGTVSTGRRAGANGGGMNPYGSGNFQGAPDAYGSGNMDGDPNYNRAPQGPPRNNGAYPVRPDILYPKPPPPPMQQPGQGYAEDPRMDGGNLRPAGPGMFERPTLSQPRPPMNGMGRPPQMAAMLPTAPYPPPPPQQQRQQAGYGNGMLAGAPTGAGGVFELPTLSQQRPPPPPQQQRPGYRPPPPPPPLNASGSYGMGQTPPEGD